MLALNLACPNPDLPDGDAAPAAPPVTPPAALEVRRVGAVDCGCWSAFIRLLLWATRNNRPDDR